MTDNPKPTDPPDTGPAVPAQPALPGLAPTLVRAAAAAGWVQATPIQAAAWPVVLAGRDVLGRSPTGSGKTAAFMLPLLQRLLAAPGVADERPRRLRALVVVPTRDLAAQTAAVARALAPALKTVVAVGGLSINPQMMALRGGAHLVVGTPGRLLDLHARGALPLGGLEMLVLDEADRLLELGFADEMNRLLALLPAARQTLLFSATLPAAVVGLAQAVLRDPEILQAAPEPPHGLCQRAIEVDAARRTPLLRHLLATEGWARALVFVATQHASEQVAAKLRQAGVPAAALHGRLAPLRRAEVLEDFKAARLAVLVATDLAARGLDIPQLGVVVNHDLPRSAVDHLHRIGRTARAGATGLAISFVCPDLPGSEAHFRLIEKRQHQRLPRERVPGYGPRPAPAAPAGAAARPPADPNGGVKGRRKSRKDKLREAAAAVAAGQPKA